MQDLFGQDVQVYRGQPVEVTKFTTEDTEKIFEELIFEGWLLKQMAEALAKLKLHKGRPSMGLARREAWEELMWVFDLWHAPAIIPFDVACDLTGSDSDVIRNAISHEFAAEIQLLYQAVVAVHPDERQHLIRRLHPYIDLRDEMH